VTQTSTPGHLDTEPTGLTREAIAALGEDVPLLEAMRTTRAIRRLRPDPVPRELIRKVCEAGTFAPSGGNRQPWRFIAVTEPERRAYVAERYRACFRSYIAPAVEAARAPDFPEARRRMLRSALHLAEHLHEAPVHLFVAGFTRRGAPQLQALFPAIQNILLACRAVGLGASLTTVHTAVGREIDAWLGLPESLPTCALLPIGWPRGRYGRPPRSSVDTCLLWERYDEKAGETAQAAHR
jgi:nitroreductase